MSEARRSDCGPHQIAAELGNQSLHTDNIAMSDYKLSAQRRPSPGLLHSLCSLIIRVTDSITVCACILQPTW